MLREALAMWRGPALAELAFEPFARAEVARLEEQRLTALEARVEADLAAGRHSELVAELQQLVAAHPTRERLAAQLMLTLYRCGRQAEALDTYRDARAGLDEIGLEPGQQLRELQAAILRQEVELQSPAGTSELPPELDTATAAPLAGRDRELAWLRLRWERAREGAGGLVVLAGERGAGKSRLAAEHAGAAHRRGDTVLYASCAGPADAAAGVLNGLRHATRPTLVVIDDADAAGPDLLAELESATRSLRSLPVLALVCCEDADVLPGLPADGVLTLEPLAQEAVHAIGRHYASARMASEVPAQWLLEASGGVPRRVHEVASQWARREAARRVTAVVDRAEDERAQLRTIEDELVGGVVELQEARGRILPSHERAPTVVCPFKGLASYEVTDAEYFFGRERLIAELVARLVGAPLLAVVGPSGSGKSSVVRAGLLPALAEGVLPGSEHWEQTLMRPGRHPVRALATAIADHESAERLVLVIDQFEETFTVCEDEAERAEFLAEVVHAAHEARGRYVLVVGLRADQYGRCAQYPELSALVTANNVLVRSMQRDELRLAIDGPCRRARLRVEHELVDALVADVEREPGGLPLLSAALLELWQRRDGSRLRHAAYVHTGGVHGAVARLAEDAFAQLNEAQQVIARAVLMRLVVAGEGGDGRVERRRAALAELEIERDEDVARVVALLTDRRLLTVDDGTVEVAHEALLRQWPRLREWIEEDREGLRIQRGLSAAMEEWERLDRDPGALLRGARLSEALEWRGEARSALTKPEREFLAAGEAAREHERVTRRRRTRLLVAAVSTVVVAGVVVGLAALFAARERATAASRTLATQSAGLIATDPPLARAVAREALERRDTPEAQNALRQATHADRATAVVRASAGKAYGLDPSPDGRSVVTAGEDKRLRLWRLGRVPAARTLTKHGSLALGAAFDPAGERVASVAYDGVVALTPISGAKSKTLLRLSGTDGEYGTSVDVARGMVVVGTSTGAVRVVPTAAGARPFVLGRHPGYVYVVATNPAGTKVVSADETGTYLWDVASRTSISLQRGTGYMAASFSPDGRQIATGGANGRLRVWNASGRPTVQQPRATGEQPIVSVRFSDDGRRIVSTTVDGNLHVSDVRSGQLLSTMPGGRALYADFVSNGIASVGGDGTLRTWAPLPVRTPRLSGTIPFFSPDDSQVVSGGDSGEVHLWNLAKGDRRLPGHTMKSITTFSPDGRQVVSVSHDKTVRFYDIGSGRSRKLVFGDFAKFAVAMNRAGQIAVGGSREGGAIIVKNVDGAGEIALKHDAAVFALAFSPDGSRLLGAYDDGTARIWNVKTQKTERVIQADAEAVRSVSYDGSGARLATAGADGTIRIWPVDGGPAVTLVGHEGPVNSAEFNHRGDRIVSGGVDRSVRVWDTTDGELLVVLHRHEGAVSGVDFNRSGTRVVSAGDDGTRITPCEVCGTFAQARRVADSRMARPLSASERRRLVDRRR